MTDAVPKYVNGSDALTPPAVDTATWRTWRCVPAAAMHVIVVAVTTGADAQSPPSTNVLDDVGRRFVPLIVTVPPPDVGPLLGVIDVIVGAFGLMVKARATAPAGSYVAEPAWLA